MGTTPDNIFTCICYSENCVEYKCPYSIQGEDITSAWDKCPCSIQGEDITSAWYKTQFFEMYDKKIGLKNAKIFRSNDEPNGTNWLLSNILCRMDKKGTPGRILSVLKFLKSFFFLVSIILNAIGSRDIIPFVSRRMKFDMSPKKILVNVLVRQR